LHGEELQKVIDHLLQLAADGRNDDIVAMVDATIPGSAVAATPPPELTSIDQS
jgi:hypothetical protein